MEILMGPTFLVRMSSLALLGLAVSPDALAQSQRIEGVNKDVFRTLQYLGTSRSSHNWTLSDAGMMVRAITKDLVYDDAERSLVAALEKETFDLIIAAARDPSFNPNDLTRKGALPPDIRAHLSRALTPAGFAEEEARQKAAEALRAGPGPGESQVDFFMRTGSEGFAKLVTYAGSSPQTWEQARSALIAEFRTALKDAVEKKRVVTSLDPASVQIFKEMRDVMRSRLIDARLSPEGRRLVLEAAASFDYETKAFKLFIASFADLLDGEDKAREALVAVCSRLGIPTDAV
jgi:hypothetical protein